MTLDDFEKSLAEGESSDRKKAKGDIIETEIVIATEAKSARDSTAIVPATITGDIPPDLATGTASEYVSPGIATTTATGTSVHVVPTTKETSVAINAITGTPKTRVKVFL
ncbi:hypothetical protein N7497_003012 [Penicillium chrysogenum]|nr:hypothetical protein N7497_003012 [Penicillium chrysogenum]